VTTAEGIRREVAAIAQELPPGATLTIVRDQSEFIEDSINDVLSNLLIGIVLTTAVLFLFLHSWRGTLIAALAMPITVVSTFVLMDAAGFTLNVMTLMALGITVGILVTNTIVVLENIYRHLDAGGEPGEAAATGTTEVGLAVAASTLTNLVVFTPIAFMGGIIGQFFYAFGITVVFATLFSIFMSFTLAPLLAARLLRTGETEREEHSRFLGPIWRRWDAAYDSLETSYRRGITLGTRAASQRLAGHCHHPDRLGARAVHHRPVRRRRVPAAVPTKGPRGSRSICRRARRSSARPMSRRRPRRAWPRCPKSSRCSPPWPVQGGNMLAVGGGSNRAEILVLLREGARVADEVVRDIRPLLADLPDTSLTVVATIPGGGPGGGAPVQLLMSGPDYQVLQDLARNGNRAAGAAAVAVGRGQRRRRSPARAGLPAQPRRPRRPWPLGRTGRPARPDVGRGHRRRRVPRGGGP
jgi:hydrophobic/amphiphilic exporter-1 (mainly G- bacteria), HAE1 family